MIFNFFAKLSGITGLPPAVLICALAITLFLIIFGILVLIKVRNIIRVLNSVNFSLDNILRVFGEQSEEFVGKTARGQETGPVADPDGKTGFNARPKLKPRKPATDLSVKNKSATNSADVQFDRPRHIETNRAVNVTKEEKPGEYAIRKEVRAKIYDLLKKTGKPTPYHELAEYLARNYPGYDYDYFLKEIEGLQKEGKVDVRLVAEKLYFQIKK